jgi:hypothetical protein
MKREREGEGEGRRSQHRNSFISISPPLSQLYNIAKGDRAFNKVYGLDITSAEGEEESGGVVEIRS